MDTSKAVSVPAGVPTLKDVAGVATYNFPERYKFPVMVYVRQLRVDYRKKFLADPDLVLTTSTPHGTLYVSAREYRLDN